MREEQNQELVVPVQSSEEVLADLQNSTKMCQGLMLSPHYKKMGAEGIFAIIQKAKLIGISPMEALDGGMYYVQGKVELSAAMMNQLIRMKKHSVTKDEKSNDQICILQGKRKDTGDTWTESFSIEDAKKAGIYRNQWLKYPKDMLFARALSRLARQLFPDILHGCYVENEIMDKPTFEDASIRKPSLENKEKEIQVINDEEYEILEDWMGDNIILRQNILTFIKRKWGIDTLQKMPKEIYQHALTRAKQQHKVDEMLGEQQQAIGE